MAAPLLEPADFFSEDSFAPCPCCCLHSQSIQLAPQYFVHSAILDMERERAAT